jgi:hypothetical protein
MTVVIPACDVRSIIEEIPELVQMRKDKDEKVKEKKRRWPIAEKAPRSKQDDITKRLR